MKIGFRVAGLLMLAAFLLVPAIAQKERSKSDLLKEIATLSNSPKLEDKEKAYQTSKEYLTRFGNDKDDKNIVKIRDYVSRFRENELYKSLDAKKYKEFYTLGKEILGEQPENLDVAINLAYGGYDAFLKNSDKSFGADAMMYTKKTIELIEAGKTPKSFAPFTAKEDTLAWMYYIDGFFLAETDKRSSAVNMFNSIRFESSIKQTSQPFYLIAMYYESVYEKTAAELNAKIKAKTISDAELAVQSEKVAKVLDLMLDAYARTSSRADAENSPNKVVIKDRLTVVYKFAKKTDVGLAEYIGYINKTQLPDPGKL